MRRFAFLVHPLVPFARTLSAVPTVRPGLLVGRVRLPDDVAPYCTLGFGDVEGVIVGIPMLPHELLADQDLALRCMERAVQEAAPVAFVGLGSVLAAVASRGQALERACGLPVTTGNAATAWAACHIARQVAQRRDLRRVAVLGGKGGVGGAVAEVLRDTLDVAVDPVDLRAFALVVGCHPNGGVVDPGALAPGTVLVDVALPRTLSGPAPRGVTVLAGESVALPPGWRRNLWGWLFHVVAGYGPRSVYACLLEPLLAVRSGRSTPFAQGRRVDARAVRELAAEADAAGFVPEVKVLAGRY